MTAVFLEGKRPQAPVPRYTPTGELLSLDLSILRQTCAIIHNMKFCSRCRGSAPIPEDQPVSTAETDVCCGGREAAVIKTIAWISAGLGVVALGLFAGRELRLRYKFKRRTPYDMYAHAGDEGAEIDGESGLGI